MAARWNTLMRFRRWIFEYWNIWIECSLWITSVENGCWKQEPKETTPTESRSIIPTSAVNSNAGRSSAASRAIRARARRSRSTSASWTSATGGGCRNAASLSLLPRSSSSSSSSKRSGASAKRSPGPHLLTIQHKFYQIKLLSHSLQQPGLISCSFPSRCWNGLYYR